MNGEAAAALAKALAIGSRLVRGVWWLLCVCVLGAVGGAVYITKLDAQVTEAVADISQVRFDISSIAANVTPRAEVLREHERIDREARRLQIQIDRLEAAAAGVPYNHRGYGAEE